MLYTDHVAELSGDIPHAHWSWWFCVQSHASLPPLTAWDCNYKCLKWNDHIMKRSRHLIVDFNGLDEQWLWLHASPWDFSSPQTVRELLGGKKDDFTLILRTFALCLSFQWLWLWLLELHPRIMLQPLQVCCRCPYAKMLDKVCI